MSDERLSNLEVKAAFLEDAVSKLDEVVRDQQQRITYLEGLCRRMAAEFREVRELLEDPDGAAEEAPPHY